jgi:hypothetical protein
MGELLEEQVSRIKGVIVFNPTGEAAVVHRVVHLAEGDKDLVLGGMLLQHVPELSFLVSRIVHGTMEIVPNAIKDLDPGLLCLLLEEARDARDLGEK